MRHLHLALMTLLAALLRQVRPARIPRAAAHSIRMLGSSGERPTRRTGNVVAFREAVRQAAKLSEVMADSGVHVEKSGGKIMARCPFHGGGTERTPSMSISDEKGVYYCFACHASGSAVTFLEQHEGMAYGEALGELARRYDVGGIEELAGEVMSHWPAPTDLSAEQQSLVAANEAAATFYQQQRRARAKPGSDAALCAEQLRARGIDNALAERFGLGFAEGGRALSRRLRGDPNVTIAAGVSAGLLLHNGGDPFDRFRSRLMIPIHDANGRVIALGGRALRDGPSEGGRPLGQSSPSPPPPSAPPPPKYLNSPESLVFSKARTLYALHLARGAIRQSGRAMIVEGYMDAIALHAVGLRYAVACLGTSLTESQLELAIAPLASSPTRTLVLALDADEAGQHATKRLYENGALARLTAKGIDVRVASLPSPYKDPDEYVQATRFALSAQPTFSRGPDGAAAAASAAGLAFEQQVVEAAPSWIEWIGLQILEPFLTVRSSVGGTEPAKLREHCASPWAASPLRPPCTSPPRLLNPPQGSLSATLRPSPLHRRAEDATLSPHPVLCPPSRSLQGTLGACVKELVALLRLLRQPAERSFHIQKFAAVLAADDEILAAQLRSDLHASLRLPPSGYAVGGASSPLVNPSANAAPAVATDAALASNEAAASLAAAPRRAPPKPPLSRLAEEQVSLQDLFVWSGCMKPLEPRAASLEPPLPRSNDCGRRCPPLATSLPVSQRPTGRLV